MNEYCLKCEEELCKHGHCSDPRCQDPCDSCAELAWERSCNDYYGGSTPQTFREQMDVEAAERWRQR